MKSRIDFHVPFTKYIIRMAEIIKYLNVSVTQTRFMVSTHMFTVDFTVIACVADINYVETTGTVDQHKCLLSHLSYKHEQPTRCSYNFSSPIYRV